MLHSQLQSLNDWMSNYNDWMSNHNNWMSNYNEWIVDKTGMPPVALPTAALAMVVFLVVRELFRFIRPKKLQMPYLDFPDGDNSMQRYFDQSGSILDRGYEQYLKKDKPYSMFNVMDAGTPMAILPTKYLNEVRNAHVSQLSFASLLNKFTMAEDIGGPLVTERVTRVVRQDLNKSLNDMIEPIWQVCGMTLGMLLPPSSDWTPFHPHTLLLQLVSQVIARAFVGPELSVNPEWHAVIMSYFQHGHAASQRVRSKYPAWLRWTAKYVDSDIKAIYAARRKGQALLQPVIDARLADDRDRLEGQKPSFNDGVSWLIQAYKAENKPIKAEQFMQDEAFVVAASIESTTITALSILFDLIDRPDCLADIREEISKVYAEYGQWNRQSLGALRVMDSFMKESQRLNTSQHNTMQRRAMQDWTFKDGLRIPAGTSIFIPSRLLSRDPEIYPNATGFDAMRWKRMRDEGDATKFHFASLQDNMLPWGSGPHACPGRFLVQETIKIFLIHLVTKYEVRYPDGIESRPTDVQNHTSSFPDSATKLMYKER